MSEAIEAAPTNNPTEQDRLWTAPKLIGIGILTLTFALIVIMIAATSLGE